MNDEIGNCGIEIRLKERLPIEREKELVAKIKQLLKDEQIDYICIWE